jgi:hypothetical protein
MVERRAALFTTHDITGTEVHFQTNDLTLLDYLIIKEQRWGFGSAFCFIAVIIWRIPGGTLDLGR